MYILTNKTICYGVVPHVYYALIDLDVIIEKYILSSSTKLADSDPEVNLD